jgi:hypothetical protein
MESTTMSKYKQLNHHFFLKQGMHIQNYTLAKEYATKEIVTKPGPLLI